MGSLRVGRSNLALCVAFSFTLLGILCGGQLALASEVIKLGFDAKLVAVSHPDHKAWAIDDFLCVLYVESEAACGFVIKSGVRGAIVELTYQKGTIREGDPVRQGKNKPGKLTSRTTATSEISDWINRPAYPFNLSAGVNLKYPVANFQITASKHFTIGIMPNYYEISVDSVKANSTGAYVTLNYYLWVPYRGPWAQLGAGAFSSSVTLPSGAESSVISMGALASLGWKLSLGRRVNMGLAGGVQYSNYQRSESPGGFTVLAFTPLVMLDLGVGF